MGKYQYGCDKVEYGTMSPTGEMTAPAEVEIHEDTIQHNEGTPTSTKIFQQGKGKAKVVRYANADETITFHVLDMSADSKVTWLGGTATTVDTVTTWHKPKGKKKPTTKALKFYCEDGSVIYVPQTSCMATLVNNFNNTDVAVITVVAEVMDCGLANVADFQWADAPED